MSTNEEPKDTKEIALQIRHYNVRIQTLESHEYLDLYPAALKELCELYFHREKLIQKFMEEYEV